MFDGLDSTQILVAIILTAGSMVVGRWAWSKLPKRDMGSSALATVQAARAAVDLMDDVNEARLSQLEERVARLEEIIVEKDAELKKRQEKIRLLEVEIQTLLRWIAALVEQVHQNGGIPITLNEIRYLDGDEPLLDDKGEPNVQVG